MIVLVRVVAGVLLLAHGLVHLLYLAQDVPEFSIEESWLVPESARRPVALALIAATIAAFAVLTLAVWGVPGLSMAWPILAIIASTLSLLLLIAFWDTRVVLGVIIDAALITLAVTQPAWTQEIVGSIKTHRRHRTPCGLKHLASALDHAGARVLASPTVGCCRHICPRAAPSIQRDLLEFIPGPD